MSKLQLNDGQWAELRDWLTHGEEKAVLRTWAAASKNLEEAPEIDTALVRAYLMAWNVKGRDGRELPVEQIDDAPGNIVATIVEVVTERWAGRRGTDPNSPDA